MAIDCERSPRATAADDAGHFAGRADQITHKRIHRINGSGPRASQTADQGPILDLSLFSYDPADAVDLVAHPLELVHDLVERVANLAAQANPGAGEPDTEIPFSQCR